MAKAKKQKAFWKCECGLLDRFNDDRDLLLYVKMRCLADRDGRIPMDTTALAARIRWPEARLVSPLAELMEPDEHSRCQLAGGRCVAFIDPQRPELGFWIPAVPRHRKRNVDTEARRAYRARKMREYRARDREQRVNTREHSVNTRELPGPTDVNTREHSVNTREQFVNCDRDRDIDIKKKSSSHSIKSNGYQLPKQNGVADSEWLTRLANDSAYSGINVPREFGKMANWCKVHRKLPTRARFVNWLNRIELMDLGIQAEEETDDRGPEGWETAAHELYPDMNFPVSFWEIQSPEVMRRIKEKLV